MKHVLGLSLFAGALLSPLCLRAEVQMSLVYEDADSYPWYMKNGDGVDVILLKMVDDKLPEVKFLFKQAPWKKCLTMIEDDKEGANPGVTGNGCFAGSYKEEREKVGVYPGNTKGSANKEQMLHLASYSLYVPKASTLNVMKKDGAPIADITGLADKAKEQIGAPLGYSIVDDLAKAGYMVDSGSKTTEQNFTKLTGKKVVAVAALTLEGNLHMVKPAFKDLKVVETPLIEKPYYLLISHHFYNKNKELSEKIWKTVAEVRESKEFQEARKKWLEKAGT